MKRRDGHRPDDAVGVVILFDRGGHHAADADAVTAHLDGLFAALGVEIGRAHLLAVLGAEIKDLADFDAAMGLQLTRLTARTGIARSRQGANRRTPTA